MHKKKAIVWTGEKKKREKNVCDHCDQFNTIWKKLPTKLRKENQISRHYLPVELEKHDFQAVKKKAICEKQMFSLIARVTYVEVLHSTFGTTKAEKIVLNQKLRKYHELKFLNIQLQKWSYL